VNIARLTSDTAIASQIANWKTNIFSSNLDIIVKKGTTEKRIDVCGSKSMMFEELFRRLLHKRISSLNLRWLASLLSVKLSRFFSGTPDEYFPNIHYK